MVQTSQGTSLKCGSGVFGYRFVGGKIRHALCTSRYFFKKLYRYIVRMYVYIYIYGPRCTWCIASSLAPMYVYKGIHNVM